MMAGGDKCHKQIYEEGDRDIGGKGEGWVPL